MIVFPSDVVLGHPGRGSVAARAHARVEGQLRGTQIAHAGREAGPIGTLVSGVIGASLRGREVPLARGTYDLAANDRAAGRAVDLPTVTAAADREQGPARTARNESMVVQGPAPDDELLAHLAAFGDAAPVCAPARRGRSRASPLGLLPFVRP